MMNIDDNRDPALAAPFEALKSAMGQVATPRGVEKELMDAFAKQFPPKRWYHALSPAQWGMAGGIGSTAFVAVLALSLSLHAPNLTVTDGGATVRMDEGPDFIALASAERIEQEPDAQVLAADVPRAALASMGVPVSPDNAGDSVRAEMLVGADGSPLALRLVSLQ
jgi:hypothetical protein